SDRIVVMNRGQIEQIDDPVSMYNRPRTRFVAGFIGRTNFLDGTLNGGMIAFDGFALRADLAPEAATLSAQASFSIRPQTIAIHRAAPPGDPPAGGRVGRRGAMDGDGPARDRRQRVVADRSHPRRAHPPARGVRA